MAKSTTPVAPQHDSSPDGARPVYGGEIGVSTGQRESASAPCASVRRRR